jgi:hypothetical protein
MPERVDLKLGESIYQADQRIDHVYFPATAVVAMIDTVEDGATVEVGIIGHEGMVGINIFLGCLVTPAAFRQPPPDLLVPPHRHAA